MAVYIRKNNQPKGMGMNELPKNFAWNRAKDQTNKHYLKWQPTLHSGLLYTYLTIVNFCRNVNLSWLQHHCAFK